MATFFMRKSTRLKDKVMNTEDKGSCFDYENNI